MIAVRVRQDTARVAVFWATRLAILLLAAVVTAGERADTVTLVILLVAVRADATAEVIGIGWRVERGWLEADTDPVGRAARLATGFQRRATGRLFLALDAQLAAGAAGLVALLLAPVTGALALLAVAAFATVAVLVAFLANVLAAGGHVRQAEPS
jgi:hypothetical protein